MSGAQAQSARDADTAVNEKPYGLRGTTSAPSSTPSTARPPTLYGALPASRGPSAASIRKPAPRDNHGQPPLATDPTQDEAAIQTESISAESALNQADQDCAASLGRQNDRVGTSMTRRPIPATEREAVPGSMLGSLILRPTLAERSFMNRRLAAPSKTSRVYSETTLSGTLQSDWSRHQTHRRWLRDLSEESFRHRHRVSERQCRRTAGPRPAQRHDRDP